LRFQLLERLIFCKRISRPTQSAKEADKGGQVEAILRNISGEDLARRPVPDDLPVAEDDETVEICDDLLKPVLGNNNRDFFFLYGSKNGPEHFGAFGVEVREGFVKQKEPGPESQNGAKGNPLFFTSGEGVRRTAEIGLHACETAHPCQTSLNLGWRQTQALQSVSQLRLHCPVKKLCVRVLEHKAGVAEQPVNRFGSCIQTVDKNTTR
jgi:hypothetical protein